ncbi:glycine/betaine/sarcosine/D-proline family reductase selenoprotein B, partial [Treponema pedis]|uniref:glycine/betaine/sarcosine/D-proline family reductase selenoprotein B n=1 Tax=Treponema pedis TaxID=409322 RepID=UPI000463DE2A
SGLYEENPGYDVFRPFMDTVKTKYSAVGMPQPTPATGATVKKALAGEKICCPEKEGLLPKGVRENYFAEERGAKRAVDMLLKKIKGEEFVTEYPMPVFDRVPPFAAVKDISKAKIALVTSGGVVPKGNPDHIEATNASHYGEYS